MAAVNITGAADITLADFLKGSATGTAGTPSANVGSVQGVTGGIPQPTILAGITAIGTHTVNSSLSAAVTLTPPGGATKLLMQALTQNVRYRLDGGIPTASVGFQLQTGGDPLPIVVPSGSVVQVIEETASATIQYMWGS